MQIVLFWTTVQMLMRHVEFYDSLHMVYFVSWHQKHNFTTWYTIQSIKMSQYTDMFPCYNNVVCSN